MATTKITIAGPVFDGDAAAALAEFTDTLAGEVAAVGVTWIKLDTQRMDRSGSDTGAAADGVLLAGSGSRYVITGEMRKGRVWWPWLEGISARNQSTGFKGYKSFRRTRLRMRKQVTLNAQVLLDSIAERLGAA